MVELFFKGGGFMWPILIALVIGIGFIIERFWTLLHASVDTRKFLRDIKTALQSGGVKEALDVSANTTGPVAAMFHAGLSRAHFGVRDVEKAIDSAGTIEMAFLERNLLWLATIATIAPMLGFTGTVQGMVVAFQQIEAANDISPAIVAGGISIALLTTLFGLIVAMIIQAFHNFFVSRIDKLVIDMEESSVELVVTLMELEKNGGMPSSAAAG